MQILIGIGIAAIIAASGGSLALAFGISGVITWGLDHSAGLADLTRNPQQATRNYFATATPGQIAADTIGTALTFAPGNFAGAAGGRVVRGVVDDLLANPGAWMAARRQTIQNARWADDAGHIGMDHFLRRDPVPLADGSTKSALSAADEAAETAKYKAYDAIPVKGDGAAKDYQVKVYGDNERRIPLGTNAKGNPIRSEPDGFTAQYGALGDSKHVGNTKSSFYIPDTLKEGFLRDQAIKDMDKVLTKLQTASDKMSGSGQGVVELTTNNLKAAGFIEGRMKTLGIRGYVRIVPE